MNEPAPSSRRFGQKKKRKKRTKLTRVSADASSDLCRRVADYFAGASAAAFFAAQRCLAASAIRFRVSGLMLLFFAFFAGVLAAGTTATPAFFVAAQRRFTASAMRFRPSGVSFLFFFAGFAAVGATAAATFFGLPTFFFPVCGVPRLSRARARCNWVIS